MGGRRASRWRGGLLRRGGLGWDQRLHRCVWNEQTKPRVSFPAGLTLPSPAGPLPLVLSPSPCPGQPRLGVVRAHRQGRLTSAGSQTWCWWPTRSDGACPGTACQFPVCPQSVGKLTLPSNPLSCSVYKQGMPSRPGPLGGGGLAMPRKGGSCSRGPQARFLPHRTLLEAKEVKGRHKARKCHRERTRQPGGRQETGWRASPD